MAKQDDGGGSGKVTLTRLQVVIVLIVFAVVVAVAGLLAGLLKSPSACSQKVAQPPKVETAKTFDAKAEKKPEVENVWTNHRLPRHLVPDHYDLVLFPDFYDKGTRLDGNVSIRINVTEATGCILVHIKDLEIVRSKVRRLSTILNDEREIKILKNFSYPKNEYWVIQVERIPPGSVVRVDLQFHGSLVNGFAGLYKSSYIDSRTGEERFLATSKFQPTDARKAFPCLDEPGFKSTFTVTLVHRPNFTALSNMPPQNVTNYSNDLLATQFEKSVPMVTYLTCFIVCAFSYKENRTRNGIPLRVYATPDKIDQVDYALSITGEILEFYEETFGLRYSLPKLDQIAIPDFVSGAMEHWGLATYRETALLYGDKEASVFNKQRVAVVVAHELAHMWFGNLVTMQWWDDLWLNEGFASFVEYIGVNHVHPDWSMDSQFLTEDMQYVMVVDSAVSSHPIIVPVDHPDEISEVFDTISYSKGASILRMLQSFMGRENFVKGLQAYMMKYQYKTATTNDLWDCLSQVEGAPNIGNVMSSWTMQMGFPVVSVEIDDDSVYRLSQERFLSDPTADKTQPPSEFNYIWQIPISWINSSGHSGIVWLKEKQAAVDLPLNLNDTSNWIKFNVNGTSYIRVNYPADYWKRLAGILRSNPQVLTASDRSMMLDDALSLAKAGLVNYQKALELTRYLDKEKDYAPWKTMEVHIVYIRNMLQHTEHYGQWQSYIRELASPVFRRIGMTQRGSHTDQMLQSTMVSMACWSGDTVCLANVTHIFRDWLIDGKYIAPSLRSIAYRYGMQQNGREDYWNRLWHAYINTSVPQEKNKILRGLTQTKEAWLLNRLLIFAMNESKIRSQDFFTVISYMTANPLGRFIAWDWARSQWPKLVARFTIGSRHLGRMIPGIVKHFNTRFQLDEVNSFFTRYPEAGAGQRGRSQAIDQIRANIAWMDRNVNDIAHWLQKRRKRQMSKDLLVE